MYRLKCRNLSATQVSVNELCGSRERTFSTGFGRKPPKKMSLCSLYQLLNEAGCICKREIPCEKPVTEYEVNEV
jgi:hypothetical protein